MKYEKAEAEIIYLNGQMMTCSQNVSGGGWGYPGDFLNSLCGWSEPWQGGDEHTFGCKIFSGSATSYTINVNGQMHTMSIVGLGDKQSYSGTVMPFYYWQMS